LSQAQLRGAKELDSAVEVRIAECKEFFAITSFNKYSNITVYKMTSGDKANDKEMKGLVDK